ncbi:hypothetical protein ACN28S_29945 [Cystobacter fuscus]
MPNAIDLTTIETVAPILGAQAADANLARMITAASATIAKYVKYPLHRRIDEAEVVASQGGKYLFLKAGAIRTINSIAIDDSEVPFGNYLLDNRQMGSIVHTKSTWPFTGTSTGGVAPGKGDCIADGSIVVTFDAGYITPGQKTLDSSLTVDLEPDIEQACIELVTSMWRKKGKDGDVASYSLGDGSVSYTSEKSNIPASVKAALKPYAKLTRRTFG